MAELVEMIGGMGGRAIRVDRATKLKRSPPAQIVAGHATLQDYKQEDLGALMTEIVSIHAREILIHAGIPR